MTDTNNAGRPAAVEALRLAEDYARLMSQEAWFHAGETFDKLRDAIAALAQLPEAPAAPSVSLKALDIDAIEAEVCAVDSESAFQAGACQMADAIRDRLAQQPEAPASERDEPVALGPQSRDLALRGLLGIIGTAQAQARRIIASEGDADDLRQDRRDLPATLDIIKKAVESFAVPVSADAQKAVAREPLTDVEVNQAGFDNANVLVGDFVIGARWAERTLAKRWGIRLSGSTEGEKS